MLFTPISSTRNTDYTIQITLFGAMKITRNTDSSKNNYTGYGLCFDEGGDFGHTVKKVILIVSQMLKV